MIKVRIQLAQGGAGPFKIASQVIREEGFASLYSGYSAALTRQVVYTGARLGLFDAFTKRMKTANDGEPLAFWQTSVCALSAGGLAALVGNPFDLSLIRMQGDNMLPAEKRANYRHVGSAFSSIVREEGYLALFNGCVPTVSRAMSLNFGMLAFNSKSRDLLADAGVQGPAQVFGASCIAGFFASFFSLPFDFVKTQMQNQKPDASGNLKYSSSLNCALTQVRSHGITRLWVGFPTYFVRIAPHAMLTLIFQDLIKRSL